MVIFTPHPKVLERLFRIYLSQVDTEAMIQAFATIFKHTEDDHG